MSLFERLVKNGVQSTMLETQSRMKPNISRFVKEIYPNLRDHASTRDRPAIRGLQKDVFFLSHQNAEDQGSASAEPGGGEARHGLLSLSGAGAAAPRPR